MPCCAGCAVACLCTFACVCVCTRVGKLVGAFPLPKPDVDGWKGFETCHSRASRTPPTRLPAQRKTFGEGKRHLPGEWRSTKLHSFLLATCACVRACVSVRVMPRPPAPIVIARFLSSNGNMPTITADHVTKTHSCAGGARVRHVSRDNFQARVPTGFLLSHG